MNTKARWLRLLNLVTLLALLLPSTGTPAAAQVQPNITQGVPPALAVTDSTSDQVQAWTVSQHTPTTDAENVEFVGHVGGLTEAVAVQGNYAYIGEGPRLIILDISNPASPTVVGKTSPLPGVVHGVYVAGDYAYIADGDAGLRTDGAL